MVLGVSVTVAPSDAVFHDFATAVVLGAVALESSVLGCVPPLSSYTAPLKPGLEPSTASKYTRRLLIVPPLPELNLVAIIVLALELVVPSPVVVLPKLLALILSMLSAGSFLIVN